MVNQDNVFRNVRNTVDHEIRLLQEKNRTLQEELGREKEKRQRLEEEVCREREECRKLEEEVCREREERQKVEGELFRERNRLVLECKICWMQPDHWVTLLCGHLFCISCAGDLDTSTACPICRAPFTGYVGCYPFAG